MNARAIAEGILRAVGILTCIVLLAYFLYEIRSVIAYITIAAVLALIGRPIVDFFRKRLKLHNTLAVIFTMLLFVGILAGVIALFIPLLIKQGQNLSLLNIEALQENLQNLYEQITNYFGLSDTELSEQIKESKPILSEIDFGFIPNFLNSFIGVLGTLSVGLFSVLFITFFFMKDSHFLENVLLIMLPQRRESQIRHSFGKIKGLLSRYFIGLVIQISILLVIYTTVLLIFGVENAVVIAFLCALLNLIPYLGPIIGGVLMVVLTMTSNLGEDFSTVLLPTTIYVFIGFIAGQLVDNFFSQPFIFSSSVRSHPLEIFLVIIIAGLLFGVVGMILAVPGYTVIKVILKEFFAENRIVRSLTKDL